MELGRRHLNGDGRTDVHRERVAATATVLLGGLVLAGIVATAAVLVWVDPWGRLAGTEGRDGEFQRPRQIDPALIQYEQIGEIRLPMEQARALAVGPDDRVYVGGENAIHVFEPDGTRHSEISLSGRPTCLAVGGKEHRFPGRVYAGMTDHVEVVHVDGTTKKSWESSAEKALLSSIAVAEEDVFVADARNATVWRYDPDGKLKHRIGDRDPARNIPGFVVTSVSPYFDLAVAHDGLLRVVNPRALRIETYTFDGDLETFWGTGASTIDGFFGCCNPSHIAILSDGRFVTVEKGIPRVKIYDGQGNFECVVAGPDQLSVGATDSPPDVAGDGQDRVLILDYRARCVRVFQRKRADHVTGSDTGAQP